MSVARIRTTTSNTNEKERWLIDWNNASLEKKNPKVYRWIITFWSSDRQASFLVSNMILTTLLTLMVRRTRFVFFPLRLFVHSRTSQVIDPCGRGVYMCARAFEQCRTESIYICIIIIEKISDVHLSLLSGAQRARMLNCPSHHISFVWYWTTFS